MFEQDWIMRQIHDMTKIIAKVVFGANVSSIAAKLPQAEREIADDLIDKMKNGKVQEAVNDVERLSDNNTHHNLLIGLEFYSHLSVMDECFLEDNAYSLIKAKKDFERFAEKFGMQQMTSLYFGNNAE